MAPPKQQPQAPFSKDERVLCFHMEMLYEAKVLDVMAGENGEGWQYKIHYKGWKSSWDDWVPQDRVRKFTEENKALASQLQLQYKQLQSGKAAKQQKKMAGGIGGGSGGGAGGSDLSSARGSEERTAAATTLSGRGPRRARDFDLEQVSLCFFGLFLCVSFCWLWMGWVGSFIPREDIPAGFWAVLMAVLTARICSGVITMMIGQDEPVFSASSAMTCGIVAASSPAAKTQSCGLSSLFPLIYHL
ncbi:chromo domain-like protein [Bombardia bombarda]|uniref:Chromatin modification-related protein EAF3 n=1 Tax=Bombardia bombarda TaxID=252184 RepID=A0AA39XI95_9PEZI|nr:chromo domain-like protein [Bombardia bombarda]